MVEWRALKRDGVRLVSRDFGGQGPPVLLIHGLAGHAAEWTETASWLTAGHRVVALDARGHGRSERLPSDVSTDALVADAAFVAESLDLAPLIAVGQSFGGLTAISLAARRPDLVRALVVVEASPAAEGDEVEATASDLGRALRSWPVPFPSRCEAVGFFAQKFGGRLAAEAWAAGLEQRQGGWWPRFDVEVIVQTLRQASPNWHDWERISCPTLVVRAGHGMVDPDAARAMLARLPGAQLAELPDARHDLHLDRPDEWRQILTAFLDSIDNSPKR